MDAAYAGSACICPEFRHSLDVIEDVDTFSLNARRWFFTTLDYCCLWVKNPGALIKSLSTYPEYLRNKASESKQVVDYKDSQITLSRRIRSMKLWLVLRSYGVTNLRTLLRSHVKIAKIFEGLVASDKRFEVVVPRNFALVHFRAVPSVLSLGKNKYENLSQEEQTNELNREFLESINASGKLYMTHSIVGGIYLIRFAAGGTTCESSLQTGATTIGCHLMLILKYI